MPRKAAQEIFASFEEKVQGAQNLLDAKALAAAGSAGLAAGHLDKVIRLSDNAKAFSESAEQSSEEAKASALAAKQDFETVKGLFSAAIQNIDNHNFDPDSHGDIRGELDLAKGRIDSIKTDQTFNPTSENAQSGKAVAEAVANVSGGTWEKLVDFTTTEEVNGVILTKEEFPKIAKCKEFLVRIVYQKHNGNANLQLGTSRIEGNNKIILYYNGTTNVSYSAVSEQKAYIHLIDGLVHSVGTDSLTGQGALKTNASILVGDRFVNEDIYQLKYYLSDATKLIPIGTKIIIYGKVEG